MSHKQIYYSDKYDDDKYEYRSVLPTFMPSSYFNLRKRLLEFELYVIPFHSPQLLSAFCLLRHVMLPKDIAKRVPKTHLMSETEWRNLGVQQSQGWVHYMIHQPGILKIR